MGLSVPQYFNECLLISGRGPVHTGAIWEDYASTIVEKYGSNFESQPIFDMDKWIEVSGGFNKGRVYDFGSSAKSQTSGSFTSQSCTSAYLGSSSQPAITQRGNLTTYR
ncbi:hypothetical protein GH714_004973 [Hevea brasiliensis]|uniref:Uncharacterized protein n=1 Tax=Hevea brasiliensis TaxID=3981 RepID=A0A6A6LWN9_HEVBR|nr:hypothetical protein GH714_004973 [Hevea brasiliensis]